ncbi:hypothetical protein EDC04DRAFT_727306 [Pisolithus marmoratus]|nr:hypothetical protein EDC04DRAFT_727306 [Pisolithus marmoratus]
MNTHVNNTTILPVCPWEAGCTLPLGITTGSVYAHLRVHGFIRKHSDRTRCPWPLCSQGMLWGNVARHILERHLGMRVQCIFCGHTYTRNEVLQVHMVVCMEVSHLAHPMETLAYRHLLRRLR